LAHPVDELVNVVLMAREKGGHEDFASISYGGYFAGRLFFHISDDILYRAVRRLRRTDRITALGVDGEIYLIGWRPFGRILLVPSSRA
jgi:hypothetical protein